MPGRENKLYGFGFDPQQSDHYFLVTVPASRAKDAKVMISEHFYWPEQGRKIDIPVQVDGEEIQLKVMLPRAKWEEIAQEVKAEFNRRLKSRGLKAGKWLLSGQVPGLGKVIADPDGHPFTYRFTHDCTPCSSRRDCRRSFSTRSRSFSREMSRFQIRSGARYLARR